MISSMHDARKLVTLCLCALLTAGAWVPLVTSNGENTTTDTETAWEVRTGGTRDNPYIIRTVVDLQNMNNDRAGHYILANDIDASATRTWNGGQGFVPIGSFSGSLSGEGFTISGLYIRRPTSGGIGLFSYLQYPALLTDVRLVDVEIQGNSMVGGLVGGDS